MLLKESVSFTDQMVGELTPDTHYLHTKNDQIQCGSESWHTNY